MREGRVANDCHRGMEACIGGTLGHGDRGSHVHTTGQGLEWGQRSQGVASYVAEDTVVGICCQHLIQCHIYVAVSASLAQLRRTWRHHLGGSHYLLLPRPKCLCHIVGGKFAGTGKVARQTSLHIVPGSEQGLHLLLHHGLAVLHDDDRRVLTSQLAYSLLG